MAYGATLNEPLTVKGFASLGVTADGSLAVSESSNENEVLADVVIDGAQVGPDLGAAGGSAGGQDCSGNVDRSTTIMFSFGEGSVFDVSLASTGTGFFGVSKTTPSNFLSVNDSIIGGGSTGSFLSKKRHRSV